MLLVDSRGMKHCACIAYVHMQAWNPSLLIQWECLFAMVIGYGIVFGQQPVY